MTGNLVFHIHGLEGTGIRQRWADSASRRLESRTADIATGLASAAIVYRKREEENRRRAREQEEERRRWEEERERRRLRAKRREEERQRIAQLVNLANDHATAARIRALLHAVEKGERAAEPGMAEWMAWAEEVAQKMDPVTGGRDLRTLTAESQTAISPSSPLSPRYR